VIDHQSRKRKIVTLFNNGEWTQKLGACLVQRIHRFVVLFHTCAVIYIVPNL